MGKEGTEPATIVSLSVLREEFGEMPVDEVVQQLMQAANPDPNPNLSPSPKLSPSPSPNLNPDPDPDPDPDPNPTRAGGRGF